MSEAVSLCTSYVILFYSDRDRHVDLFPYLSLVHDRRPNLASRDARHDVSDYDSGLVYEMQKNAYPNCDLRNDAFALFVWKAKELLFMSTQIIFCL